MITISLGELAIIVGCGVILTVVSILIGGWIVFKTKNSVPGETFLGRVPKGEVFSIPTTTEDEIPEEIKERNKIFQKIFEEVKP
jgi:hypothetical protein